MHLSELCAVKCVAVSKVICHLSFLSLLAVLHVVAAAQIQMLCCAPNASQSHWSHC